MFDLFENYTGSMGTADESSYCWETSDILSEKHYNFESWLQNISYECGSTLDEQDDSVDNMLDDSRPSSPLFLDGEREQHSSDLIDAIASTPDESIGLPDWFDTNTNEPLGDFWSDMDKLFAGMWESVEPFFPFGGTNSYYVDTTSFTQGGGFDPVNKCVVEGNVVHDIPFIQQQTTGSCSLMAQEQFVHRMTGNSMSESQLEQLGQQMGVYHPNSGTISAGMGAILDHCGIPNTHHYNASLSDIESATARGEDILISVDSRQFYKEPWYAPGGGHAVAIVGHGHDAVTGELKGYYITDSNFPGGAHFKTIAELKSCWTGDMIIVQGTTAV